MPRCPYRYLRRYDARSGNRVPTGVPTGVPPDLHRFPRYPGIPHRFTRYPGETMQIPRPIQSSSTSGANLRVSQASSGISSGASSAP